jgi:hypothetical protein
MYLYMRIIFYLSKVERMNGAVRHLPVKIEPHKKRYQRNNYNSKKPVRKRGVTLVHKSGVF